MKKTLIAAAVAAAVAAPAANAGVEIYGRIHLTIDYEDAELSGGDTPGGGYNVNSRASRLGFKGTEDLGNGLKAIWRVENTLRLSDTSSDKFSHDGSKGHFGSARNAYIGLAGDWGTFLYGRHDTPYKMAFYATGIDMLGDSIIDVNATYSVVEVRADDAIAYVSPNWNGLSLAAAIVPGEGYDNSKAGKQDGIADNYSIAAMYSNNGLKMAAGYEVYEQGLQATLNLGDALSDSGGKMTNTLFGAGWSGNNFDLSAIYVMQEYAVDIDIWVVSGAYTWGNNKFIANFGNTDVDGVGDENGYGVAVQHMFSKRTSAYLAYTNGAGRLKYNASTVDGIFQDFGQDSEGVSFGMIHNF